MSLHTLANHLQSAGRGDDKVLVHMTPGEVNGLQKLAMAHGGSLTTNPETGLPEAGFLSSMLPMIAGIALAPATGGASLGITQAWQTAALVGGVTGLATGSLSKGLMAGLGAYGGAGLGEGLMSMGAKASIPAGANALGAGAGTGAEYASWMATDAGKLAATQAAPTVAGTASGTALPALGSPGSYFDARLANYNAMNPVGLPINYGGVPSAGSMVNQIKPFDYGLPGTEMGLKVAPTDLVQADKGMYSLRPERSAAEISSDLARQEQRNIMRSAIDLRSPAEKAAEINKYKFGYPEGHGVGIPKNAELYNPTLPNVDVSSSLGPRNVPLSGSASKVPSKFDQFTAGVKASTTNGLEGAKELWNAMPQYSGIASAASLYQALTPEEKEIEAQKNEGMIRPYDFAYNPTGAANEAYSGSGERVYFNPTFTARTPYKAPGPEYAAEGGLMAARYAVGGQVEEMSAQNAISANQMYPQSQLKTDIYSNPMMQRPVNNNVITGGMDAPVNAYTGEAKFAEGGETTGGYKYGYNPQTQQFTQTGTPQPVSTGRGFQGMMNTAAGLGNLGGVGMTGAPQGNGVIARALRTQQAAPTVSAAPVISGGLSAPYMPPNQPQMGTATGASQAGLGGANQSLVPNINIPAYQTPEQQLGLESFYPMMDKKLAERGAQMIGVGYAEGGYTRAAPLNQKMASVDTAAAQMKTQQGLLKTIAAAKAGDQAALIALQKSGYDMNKLNEYAGGGDVYSLGSYSDGGRLLRGPGDGVSDSIPAVIGNKQPARLADGEFVVPARIVSELGNGSTEAGAKKLYAMMNRVQSARKKSVGKNKVAVNSRSDKYLPA